MKKVMVKYLKKVQALQAKALGKKTFWIDVYRHEYEDGNVIVSITVTFKLKNDEFSNNLSFLDNETEKTYEATYERMVNLMLENGYEV